MDMRINNLSEYIQIIQDFINSDRNIYNEMVLNLRNQNFNQAKIDTLPDYYLAVIKNMEDSSEKLKFINQQAHHQFYPTPETNFKFFYRGHYSLKYELIPSAFRGKNWEKEDYYYHEIMVRCPRHFSNTSHLDRIVTMQHFSCPTRLLDVTTNPLVALFFACKNFGCVSCDKSISGCVFVFPVFHKDVAYADSARALLLSCIARFSISEKKEMISLSNKYLKNDKFEQVKGGSRYLDNIIEKFYHEISTELPSFKRELRPIDLLKPLFVQPNKTNDRMLKQDGAFILSGLSQTEKEATEKLNATNYKRIVINNREHILRELDNLGINEAALFPEVDRVANYLKESIM